LTPCTPKISALNACYNAEGYIEAALASLRAQTDTVFEIIVVDDGSNDGCASILERYVDERFHLLRQTNDGAARARNIAFRHSTGDFVLFMYADDLVSPAHLEPVLSRASEAENCVALSRWARFVSDPAEATFPPRSSEQDLLGPDWLELDSCNARPMTQSAMLLLPRGLLEQHGEWDERLTYKDDFQFFARLISRCSGVRSAPYAHLYYRSAAPGSLSSRKSKQATESGCLALDPGTRHLVAAKDTASTRCLPNGD
jgi:glycosyltransferase involved in cell wall biosynthesis